ncbi:VOC family protein (plasmid) [Rhizobium sp. T1470]|uniref:VOC family protein n=1 Tax=unclassified Rhizobium TaxID=2613769 RepID=UPI001CD700BF|nr:VOC family protein [Rhizobium sp. T1473]MCA0806727.1 VOC family protein [Rhizobium sp. T1473]
MTDQKPKLVGLNHIALEVGDVDEALRFYGKIFSFELRGTHSDDTGSLEIAFIDMGDQFLAMSRGRSQSPDTSRHFGLVVDDRSGVMALAVAAGATVLDGRPFNFLDPWGNHVEVVEYRDVQFTKSTTVLNASAFGGRRATRRGHKWPQRDSFDPRGRGRGDGKRAAPGACHCP